MLTHLVQVGRVLNSIFASDQEGAISPGLGVLLLRAKRKNKKGQEVEILG